jgi:hypothetical protein
MTAPSTTGTPTSGQEGRYEEMRRHAIEPHEVAAVRDGLTVLLGQGLAAWVEAWSKLPAPRTRAVQDEPKRPPMPEGASAEIVRVLAAMALGHFKEVHA